MDCCYLLLQLVRMLPVETVSATAHSFAWVSQSRGSFLSTLVRYVSVVVVHQQLGVALASAAASPNDIGYVARLGIWEIASVLYSQMVQRSKQAK